MALNSAIKALAALTLAFSSISSVAAASNTTSICASSSKCIPFTIELTWAPSDPSNALSRYAILTNGSIPGPPLKMTVGECVDFTVINNMPNVTGIHFHGIRQLGTPWADGVPGVSQKVIQTNTTYMYQWTAEDSGAYFYHSHYKGQIGDGLYGAIIIAPADGAEQPFSLISNSSVDIEQMQAAEADVEYIMTTDWSAFTFAEFLQIEKDANIDDACTDSILLNGMGSTYCPSVADLTANAAVQVPQILNGTNLTAKGCIPASNAIVQGAQFTRNLAVLPPAAYDVCTPYTGKNYTNTVDPSKGWAAMSFISPAGFALFRVTIDSHKLFVYEINGNYIIPQEVDQISVSNGDRISFFVKLDQTPADYTIRVANEGINQVISGFGVLSYKGASGFAGVGVMNYGGQNTTIITSLINAIAAPFPASAVSATADTTFIFDIMKDPSQPTEAFAWTLSGVEGYNQSLDDAVPPLLFEDPSSIAASDLVIKTYSGSWVDLIIKIAGPLAEPHPIHKHANKFYMIGAGVGAFNFTTVAAAQDAGYRFNLVNPPYVDGFTSIPAEGNSSWMVFRYEVNTPGAWLLHCHVQTHFSGGMGLAILDAVDQFPTVPSDVGKVCTSSITKSSSSNSTSSNDSNGSGNGSGSSSSSTASGTATATTPTQTSSGTRTLTPSLATYTGAAVSMIPSALFGVVAIAMAMYA